MHRIMVFVTSVGWATLLAACRELPAPQATPDAPMAVSTAAVTAATLASPVEAGGVVRSRTTAVISSRIMAAVVAVDVRAGDRVRRGAPLLRLDDREVEANRTRAAAAVVSAAEEVRAAQSEVRSGQAALTLAQTMHERIRTLHDKRSATPQELDQAVAALDVADARFAQAQAHLAAATAAHEAARAASDAAAVARSYATLAAPFDGVVTERSVDPGSMATPGMGLVTVEDIALFRLEVSVDESRAANVKAGDDVRVQIGDGQVPNPVSGRVSEIARVDPSSHNAVIKIDLPSVNGLRSGVFGRAFFKGVPRQGLVVPASAGIRRGQLTFVFTLDRNNRARLRSVSPGIVDGDRLEILAGLRENDIVITNPPPSLMDGAPVTRADR
ncbi:MAG TPA: efflux RND transporter periplasmic adaptor subunit [Vicinamibacterales bacterium]|nr:efflux RND transporter periplasmic adaptor subunit [Vicinamibacterales bacterium]